MTPAAALGLYIHVPFCRCKCAWCAFASEEGVSRSGPWLDRVLTQAASLQAEGARWSTVYLGGGTPSLLTPDQLDTLLAALGPGTVPRAEITMEANPESLVSDHLAVLSERGGTRLSLGVQTFDEGILERHGRPTRRSHLDGARRLVRDWAGSLSLDLICGLGGQSEAGQARDLDEALGWNPDHLSFYSLTVEPGTSLARRVSRGTAGLPQDEETERWWLAGRDRLEGVGLAQYEVSNFSVPGAGSVHNGRYWSLEPWWGLGPSAVSFLPRVGGGFEYRTEVSGIGDWLTGALPAVEVPSALDLKKDRLLAGMRRTKGVPREPWVTFLPRTLRRWSGRILDSDGQLFLTREAFPFLDAFLREAFSELDEQTELR